ncbi:DedA family protein [Lactobacillus intestinalis]|uniref:Alkaline phosphatase n=1 Tax=Lactobacillus intestinalis DSM 6629 TaxID=1423761 RepID=A0ABR5PPI1_9LACO|nr:DedA family protein [Lactobacillus intestinalis]KRM32157.1 alkaline phosphatase [Lactobacillus intestinalis DSM 6629]UTW39693.1 DedA family protein [Lactobacillus intestinalis]
MTALIFSFIDHFGYLAVALLIAIENVFPPIPSEVILSFSGFMTSKTSMTTFGLIIASTIGAVVGALILYWIGTLLNADRLEKLFNHTMFKRLGFKKDDVKKSIAWFDKHGVKAIFFGRCIPVVRSLISIPAGIAKVNMRTFLTLTTLGSLIWNSILIFLGSYMGAQWEQIVLIFEEYSLVVITFFIIGIFYFSYYWYKNRIKKT